MFWKHSFLMLVASFLARSEAMPYPQQEQSQPLSNATEASQVQAQQVVQAGQPQQSVMPSQPMPAPIPNVPMPQNTQQPQAQNPVSTQQQQVAVSAPVAAQTQPQPQTTLPPPTSSFTNIDANAGKSNNFGKIVGGVVLGTTIAAATAALVGGTAFAAHKIRKNRGEDSQVHQVSYMTDPPIMKDGAAMDIGVSNERVVGANIEPEKASSEGAPQSKENKNNIIIVQINELLVKLENHVLALQQQDPNSEYAKRAQLSLAKIIKDINDGQYQNQAELNSLHAQLRNILKKVDKTQA